MSKIWAMLAAVIAAAGAGGAASQSVDPTPVQVSCICEAQQCSAEGVCVRENCPGEICSRLREGSCGRADCPNGAACTGVNCIQAMDSTSAGNQSTSAGTGRKNHGSHYGKKAGNGGNGHGGHH